MAETQILRALIRQGQEEKVRVWMGKLSQRPEAADAMKAEGVLVESVFFEERGGRLFLWLYQRAESLKRANEVFLSSTNPVDVEMRSILQTAFEQAETFPVIFDYARS